MPLVAKTRFLCWLLRESDETLLPPKPDVVTYHAPTYLRLCSIRRPPFLSLYRDVFPLFLSSADLSLLNFLIYHSPFLYSSQLLLSFHLFPSPTQARRVFKLWSFLVSFSDFRNHPRSSVRRFHDQRRANSCVNTQLSLGVGLYERFSLKFSDSVYSIIVVVKLGI